MFFMLPLSSIQQRKMELIYPVLYWWVNDWLTPLTLSVNSCQWTDGHMCGCCSARLQVSLDGSWMVVLFVNQAYKWKNLFQTSNKYHGRTLDLKYNYLIMKPLWLATESHKILAKPLILVMFNKFIEYGWPVNVTVSRYWPDGARNVPVLLQYPSWPSPDLTPPMLCRQYWSSQ